MDLLEQAVALLRRTPLGVFFYYYLGAVPFWLGIMYFAADMSRSAFASERIGGSSLLVALLFIHMKCWHAVFGSRLREMLMGETTAWNWGRVLRLVTTQAIWQPTGLIVRPCAYVATLPTVWVSAFYQNLTILGDGREEEGRSPAQRAWRQAALWPWQAHSIFGALLMFGTIVWINALFVIGLLPQLLKMLLGWETMASRSPEAWVLNTTFHTVVIAITFMCLDPLWKAIFALRCFYGESVRSGADLQVQLKGVGT
jgi:hypothetical protein